MAGVIAAATVGVGLVSAYSAKRSADKATGAASDASAASLAFDQEQYDDWQEVYGPIQDNLADYYSNLTPEYYEAVGLEAFNQEIDTSMTRLDESLAQRGIDPSSGIGASLKRQTEIEGAEGRATIRRDAPRQVAEDKSRFLQIGMGSDPTASLSSNLADQARLAEQRSDSAQQAAGKAMGSVIDTAGTALVDYLEKDK